MEDLRIRSTTAVAHAVPATPTLLVQIAPDALRPTELYWLTAALQREGHPQHVLAGVEEAESLDAIKARVDGLFGEVYRELGYEPEMLTVEVVVPRVLLTEPVDQWDLTELLAVPIGSRFLVVLRSYERLRQHRLWPVWRAKWNLAQNQGPPDSGTMHYLAPEDRSGPHQIATQLRPDRKLALVCGRPPARQSDLKPYDAYVAALSVGIAYMVWVRDVSIVDEFRAAVEEALATGPVRDLPRRIAEWRRLAVQEPDTDLNGRLGSHVSVFVCDYDREVQFSKGVLKAPSRRDQA
jgi:hypothetical protein